MVRRACDDDDLAYNVWESRGQLHKGALKHRSLIGSRETDTEDERSEFMLVPWTKV